MQNLHPEPIISQLELNLPRPQRWGEEEVLVKPRTPSVWFAQKFPDQAKQYGCPVLEMRQSTCDGFSRVTPVSINQDFFASMLRGDSRLGHSVVYFEPEMQFYYREPVLNIYKPTSPEKLANYYRAMMLRCAQELNGEVDKLNLFSEFRSEKNARAVVQRAKSVLAADSSFFSATSPHQRIKGPELHERLIFKLVETMLEPREGSILTVTQAYELFCQMTQRRSLDTMKRSMFRELMRDLVKDRYGMALRHDVPDSKNKHQQAWKGLRVVEAEVLAA